MTYERRCFPLRTGSWLMAGLLVAACSGEVPTDRASISKQVAGDPFNGTIGKSLQDSEPDHLPPPPLATGKPNVVIIMVDDLGYADISPYGSEINTPSLQALADSGVVYNHFTATGVCSSTRAALLTGLNHHSAGMGWLAEWDMGFPGYRGEMPENVATLPEILQEQGFATLMVGKWHLTRSENRTPFGPFDSWPTNRGFDRYWGFLDGEVDQFKPHMLVSGTEMSAPPENDNFYFPDAMTDHAITMLRDLRSVEPDKPFFLYYATGAPHAPHHTKPEDRANYTGKYAQGYDAIREQRLARQKALGIVPHNTQLTERVQGTVPWNELTADQKKMYARFEENYAAFVDNLDQNIGRLRNYLAESGELDNTIMLFLSDNGASREVGVEGSANVMDFFHNLPRNNAENLQFFDTLGDETTFPHYPHAWMQASNTPFTQAKRTSWAGGVRVPFILSWPAGNAQSGAIRTQFHHVNDIAPTVLELLNIPQPQTVGGRTVKPMEGISLAYSLADGAAKNRKTGQYYEIEAQRAYTKVDDSGTWKLVSYRHDEALPYDANPWQLFKLDEDFAETTDVAKAYPEKVAELDKLWWDAAQQYNVLPLIDMPLLDRAFRTRVSKNPERKRFRLAPGAPPMLVGSAPQLPGFSYSVDARVNNFQPDNEGVLIANGDAHAGWTFYIQGNRLVYELHNGYTRYEVASNSPLPPGDHTFSFRYDKVNTALALASGLLGSGEIRPMDTLAGKLTLQVDGETVSETLDIQIPLTAVWEGMDVGRDSGSPVSNRYTAPFKFPDNLQDVVILRD